MMLHLKRDSTLEMALMLQQRTCMDRRRLEEASYCLLQLKLLENMTFLSTVFPMIKIGPHGVRMGA